MKGHSKNYLPYRVLIVPFPLPFSPPSLSLRIHIETSSVLIRQLPVDYLECPPNWKYAPISSPTPAGTNAFVKVNEEEITLGKPNDFPTYGWDNEYGTKTMK